MRRIAASVLALAWAGAASALVACGDDTVLAPLDAGGTGVDATIVPDASADVSDAGCVPYDASSLDPAAVEAGAALVTVLRCQHCHGQTLSGNPDGVPSPQTEGGTAYPPNLTPDPTTGLGCWTDQQIETAFLYGIDNEGQPLCPPMPHFAEAGVDASGAADILAYLRSLQATTLNVPDTPNCTLGPLPSDGGAEDAEGDAEAAEAGSDGAAGDAPAGDSAGGDASADAATDAGAEAGGDSASEASSDSGGD